MSSKPEEKSETKEEAKVALEALEGELLGAVAVTRGYGVVHHTHFARTPSSSKQRTMNLKNLIQRTGTRIPWKKKRNNNGWRTGMTTWMMISQRIYGKN